MLTRRKALQLLAAAAPTLAMRKALAQAVTANLPITPGPFAGTRESLATYRIPEWFTDAKFGIWSHWGPQSAVGDGDWYARNMYMQGSPQYDYHIKRFGHPSKVGYKDVIPVFTADKWDPDHLMDLYVKAGAKYFFSMGVHHDNYDMWNSKYQPRWNAVASGPKKDIVGLWGKAARDRGLRFGVSEHLSNSFSWYAPAHLSDSTGPLTGIPYDGTDPKSADLYHDYTGMPADFARTTQRMNRDGVPDRWKLEYFRRVKDLVDQHKPDLLYTDGLIPFEEYGLSLVAEEYNLSAKMHGGKVESVYFSKKLTDSKTGTCALDRERGISDGIWPTPWQTDTCIGQWHYKKDIKQYKTAKVVIDLLVDIVSKNGNLLLNFPLPANGELDDREMATLNGIIAWMTVNSEGIHSTRPWKIYGDGPSTKVLRAGVKFNESAAPPLGTQDVRYTTKGNVLYAFVMGWPEKEALIPSCLPDRSGKIANVRLLGHDENLKFTQDQTGLRITLPKTKPATADVGIAFKMQLA